MNARAAIVVAALVIATLVAAPLLRRYRLVHPHMSAAADLSRGQATPRTTMSAANDAGIADATPANLPDAPSRDLIGRDGVAAAELWQQRAARVMYAKNRKEFGDEVARLMQLPYDKAWTRLRDLADAGSVAAATALLLIGSTCNAETLIQDQKPHEAPSPASRFFRNLPQSWKPFVDWLAEIERADYSERVSHCAGAGDTWDFAMLLLDKLLQPDHPEVLADMVADNTDADQAIADLRELITKGAGPHAEFLLGDRLLGQHDSAQQAEGRALLERLAADDPTVATRLADCLMHGCKAFAAEPGAARPWLERAAGGGNEFGIALLMQDLDARGDAAGAWAWSLYNLDLALDGCFELITPSYRAVASAAENESRRKAALSPEQQNAGLATFYEISGLWESKAKEHLACAN